VTAEYRSERQQRLDVLRARQGDDLVGLHSLASGLTIPDPKLPTDPREREMLELELRERAQMLRGDPTLVDTVDHAVARSRLEPARQLIEELIGESDNDAFQRALAGMRADLGAEVVEHPTATPTPFSDERGLIDGYVVLLAIADRLANPQAEAE
jgi:hypothetical protein